MEIGTLRKFLCTLSIGVALLLAMSVEASAQGRHSNGRWRARNYGQWVSAQRHRRNRLRHRLNRHQWNERRQLNARFRLHREQYGNSREWRLRQRQQRTALRLHQQQERSAFRERWRNNNRGRRH